MGKIKRNVFHTYASQMNAGPQGKQMNRNELFDRIAGSLDDHMVNIRGDYRLLEVNQDGTFSYAIRPEGGKEIVFQAGWGVNDHGLLSVDFTQAQALETNKEPPLMPLDVEQPQKPKPKETTRPAPTWTPRPEPPMMPLIDE